jgi:hypothetical protein
LKKFGYLLNELNNVGRITHPGISIGVGRRAIPFFNLYDVW